MKKEGGKVTMSNGDTQPKTDSPTHLITLLDHMHIHPPMHPHTTTHAYAHATQSPVHVGAQVAKFTRSMSCTTQQ